MSELLAALIGLVGALVGAWIGSRAAHSYAAAQHRVSLTLRMFDEYQILLPDRLQADILLTENKNCAAPKSLEGLYGSLSADKWSHISRVRHYWGHVALLKASGYLDEALAKSLLAEHAHYWWSMYFEHIEKLETPKHYSWQNT